MEGRQLAWLGGEEGREEGKGTGRTEGRGRGNEKSKGERGSGRKKIADREGKPKDGEAGRQGDGWRGGGK